MPLGVLSLSRLKINVREMRWLFLTPSKSKSYNRPEFIRNHQLRGLETITVDDPSFVRRTRSHISISGTQIHLVLSTLVLNHYILCLTFELWTVNGAHMVFQIFPFFWKTLCTYLYTTRANVNVNYTQPRRRKVRIRKNCADDNMIYMQYNHNRYNDYRLCGAYHR